MTPGRGPMMKTGRGIPSSLCSPAQQRKDATTGKKVPEGAKFGETSKTTDEYGATVYTTPYSKEGKSKSYKQFAAEGGDVAAAKKWREKNKSIKTPDTKGVVQNKSINPEGVGVNISGAKNTPKAKIIQPKKRTLTPPSSTNSRRKTTTTGKIKKAASKVFKNAVGGNRVSGNKAAQKGGCFTN